MKEFKIHTTRILLILFGALSHKIKQYNTIVHNTYLLLHSSLTNGTGNLYHFSSFARSWLQMLLWKAQIFYWL